MLSTLKLKLREWQVYLLDAFLHQSVKPTLVWNAALLFGWGLLMRIMPSTIYTPFGWEGIGLGVWATFALVASVGLLIGSQRRFGRVVVASTVLSISVYLRATLAFAVAGLWTGTYVYLLHTFTMLWVLYRSLHADDS